MNKINIRTGVVNKLTFWPGSCWILQLNHFGSAAVRVTLVFREKTIQSFGFQIGADHALSTHFSLYCLLRLTGRRRLGVKTIVFRLFATRFDTDYFKGDVTKCFGLKLQPFDHFVPKRNSRITWALKMLDWGRAINSLISFLGCSGNLNPELQIWGTPFCQRRSRQRHISATQKWRGKWNRMGEKLSNCFRFPKFNF